MNLLFLLFLLWSVLIISGEFDYRVLTTLNGSNFYMKPTVINGIPAHKGQMPYLVSIKERVVMTSKTKYIWTSICGGSIISRTKVLTAAHCFETKDFFYFKDPQRLRLVAGKFTRELIHTGRTHTTEKSQWRQIKKIILHEKFIFPDNDIALVITNKPWRYNHNVGFVATARRRNIDYFGDCIVAGFASISRKRDKISPILLVGHMFLLPRKNCTEMYQMNMNRFICSYSFMSDAGRGDSGGPLTCTGTRDSAEKKGRPLLVGVVSAKNFDRTLLFTRVAYFRKWIDTH